MQMPISRRTALGGLVGAAGSAGIAHARDGVLARVLRDKQLRMGAVAGQAPYCYRDLASGEWRGFLIDLGQHLAADLGVRMAPIESTWGNAVLDLQADKVDVFFGLAPTAQRALAVDFTHPLYQNAFALIARAGFNPTRWADLDDPAVRIAVEAGTQYDQSVPQLCPNATLLRLKTNNEALLSVQAGHADCQIIVIVLALTSLTKNPRLGHLVVPQPVFGNTTNGMVAKEPDPSWRNAIDAWIDRSRADGAIRQMLVDNLQKVGVSATSVPPEMLF